jgi:hypothetical protein
MKTKHSGPDGFGTDNPNNRDKGGINPDHKAAYMGLPGQGPVLGQGHHGMSARLSDSGSHKRPKGQETGSHSGARREHSNPGPQGKRRGRS